MTSRTLRVGAVPHSYDGSSYYRMWLPFKNLDDHSLHSFGIAKPEDGPLSADQVGDRVDVLVLQRPAGKAGLLLLENLIGRAKLVYEVDDDMLQPDPAGLPHLYDEKVKESVRRCVRMCDMVTVTNRYLADTLSPYNDHIEILPNYVKRNLVEKVQRVRRAVPVVGWAGGTSHLIDMVTIQQPLRQVLDRNTVCMHWMGSDFSPLVGIHCHCDLAGQRGWRPWEKDVGVYYQNVDFDIAVAPSADIPFNRSKTAIRALEMAALGIPIVAQNRLPYSEFVIDGKTGFLVDGDQEWEDRLEELIGDEDLREQLGQNAKTQASELTIEKNWWRWETAYEQAAAL